MLRLMVPFTAAAVMALLPGSAGGGTAHVLGTNGNGCCVDFGLSVTYDTASGQARFTFAPPTGYSATHWLVGSGIDGDGNVTGVTNSDFVKLAMAHGGTFSVDLLSRPKTDFWAQIQASCDDGMYRCPGGFQVSSQDYRAHSAAVKVQVAAPASGGTTGGTGSTGSETVTFSQTVTVLHADGRTEKTKSTVLVDGDLVRSYGNPTRIKIANGQVVIDRKSELQHGPSRGVDWRMYSGQGYFDAKTPTKVWVGHITAVGTGRFTVTSSPQAYIIRNYGGSVAVNLQKNANVKVTLRTGEQVLVPSLNEAERLPKPTRFKTPANPFWK